MYVWRTTLLEFNPKENIGTQGVQELFFFCDLKALEIAVLGGLLTVMIRVPHSRILVPDSIQWHYRV